MAVGSASGSGSSSKGSAGAGKGSAGASKGAAGAGKSRSGPSKSEGSKETSKSKESKSSTTDTTDRTSVTEEAKATEDEDKAAKAKAENFESRFNAAFDEKAATTEDVEKATQDLEESMTELTEAKEEGKAGVDVDRVTEVSKKVTSKTQDLAKVTRKSRRAARYANKLGIDIPANVERNGRKANMGLSSLSAVNGIMDLATNDDLNANQQAEVAMKAAEDIASSSKSARGLGIKAPGLNTLGRVAGPLGVVATGLEGANQVQYAEDKYDTISGSLKTASALTGAAGMTSVIGAFPAAIASGAMYGTAFAIDNRDVIGTVGRAAYDYVTPDVPRSQDPAYELTQRGYRAI